MFIHPSSPPGISHVSSCCNSHGTRLGNLCAQLSYLSCFANLGTAQEQWGQLKPEDLMPGWLLGVVPPKGGSSRDPGREPSRPRPGRAQPCLRPAVDAQRFQNISCLIFKKSESPGLFSIHYQALLHSVSNWFPYIISPWPSPCLS